MQYDTKSETAKKAKRLRGKHKSAQSGEFVSHEEAAANPDSTYKLSTEPRWTLDEWRVFFNALSWQVLEKVQEQFSENTDIIAGKPALEQLIREVLGEKTG